MIKTVIGEDHEITIHGLKQLLKNEKDIQLLGYARNGKELCELVKKKKPDVVIIDIKMPVMDGIKATKRILRTAPETKIIALTGYGENRHIREILNSGAQGYILKLSNPEKLLLGIRTVYNGKKYYDSNLPISEINKFKGEGVLTKREKEVYELVIEGRSTKEIAAILHITKGTVESHRKKIRKKLGIPKGKPITYYYYLDRKESA